MEWISVKDRLPEDDNEVLVWPIPNRETNVITASYNPYKGSKDYGKWMYAQYETNWGDEYYETTARFWMPLPKPPKE